MTGAAAQPRPRRLGALARVASGAAMVLLLVVGAAAPAHATPTNSLSVDPAGDITASPTVTGKSAMEHLHSNQLVAMWTAAGANRHFKLLPLPPEGRSSHVIYDQPPPANSRSAKHVRGFGIWLGLAFGLLVAAVSLTARFALLSRRLASSRWAANITANVATLPPSF